MSLGLLITSLLFLLYALTLLDGDEPVTIAMQFAIFVHYIVCIFYLLIALYITLVIVG